MEIMPRTKIILSDLMKKIKEELLINDIIEITMRDIIANYGVGLSTAYVISAMLEKNVRDMYGNICTIERKRGKLIITKKNVEPKPIEIQIYRKKCKELNTNNEVEININEIITNYKLSEADARNVLKKIKEFFIATFGDKIEIIENENNIKIKRKEEDKGLEEEKKKIEELKKYYGI